MRLGFGSYHPVPGFLFFCAVIVSSMFPMRPILQILSFLGAFIYSLFLNGRAALKFNLCVLLPLMVCAGLINPLFNHRGVTILGYIGANPLTLESIYYGIASGFMLGSVLIWFSCYSAVMTSDKFIYLFGRFIPGLSLIFSMVLRFVPRFHAQIRVISEAQRCIGRDAASGSIFRRARRGMKNFSILLTWALENAVDTADAMRARGYGLPGRTAFSMFRFDGRDGFLLGVLLALVAVLILGAALGIDTVRYFPSVKFPQGGPFLYFNDICFGLLCFLPVILDVYDSLRWRQLERDARAGI